MKDLGLDQDATILANYLQNTNHINVDTVRGDSLEAREKTHDWLIKRYSETLVTRGMTYSKLFTLAGTDAAISGLIERLLTVQADTSTEPLRFSDYRALSEITLIAEVGSFVPDLPMSGGRSGAYYLDVKHPLNNVLPNGPIALLDAYSAHDTFLEEGKECVFFLSPTLTRYRKAFSLFGRRPREDWPVNVLEKTFTPYCMNDGHVFTQGRDHEGGESLERNTLLSLANQE